MPSRADDRPRSDPRRLPARSLPGQRAIFGADRAAAARLRASSSGPFTIAYQTYGRSTPTRSNAILVCHALTGDQFAAEPHPVTGKPGWWQMHGRRRACRSTPSRYFMICANVLGGCMGTTGPREIDPATGQPYGLTFPVITVGDMVRAQALLLDHLGIEQLFCVIGGSMGGMQVLQWAATYPQRVFAAVPIACAARHSAQNIAFHEVGRQAIMADPDWCGGDYLSRAATPAAAWRSRAWRPTSPICRRRRCTASSAATCRTGPASPTASTPTSRSRAICATRARPSSTASTPTPISTSPGRWTISTSRPSMAACCANAFRGTTVRFCLISFTSDWLFPTRESRAIVHALNAVAANVSFVEIETDKGHDAFLLDEPEFAATLRGFLDGCAEHRGLRRG